MRTISSSIFLGVCLVLAGCGDDDGGGGGDKDAGSDSGGPIMSPPEDSGTPPIETMFECGPTQCTVPQLDPDQVQMLAENLLGGTDAGGLIPGGLGAIGSFITPESLMQFGVAPAGCCVGDDMDVCGVTADMFLGGTCYEQNQAGEPDTACPDVEVQISVMGFNLPFTLEGCCRTDDDLCGLDFSLFGVGCLERTMAAEIDTMGSAMILTDAGEGGAISCGGGNDAGSENDGG